LNFNCLGPLLSGFCGCVHLHSTVRCIVLQPESQVPDML